MSLLAASVFCKYSLPIRPFRMPEVHLKENWRKSPSLYHTSWRTMPTSEMGGRDWDVRATSSLAADAPSCTSERVERAESGVGKKSEMQQKYLNVSSDDLWCIRDKLAGKKSSLGKTCKTEREANDTHDNGFEVVVTERSAAS